MSKPGEEEIRRKGRHDSPLKGNKFCTREARVPPCVSVNQLVLWTGLRGKLGGAPTLITGVVSPADVCLNLRMFHPRATSIRQPLSLLSLIYGRYYYSTVRTAVT